MSFQAHKPLSADALVALRAVPVDSAPNRLSIAIALAQVTGNDVAAAAGIARPNFTRILKGHQKDLHVSTAARLASYFGCEIADLFPRLCQSSEAVSAR